jgi:hypothetical protein
LQAARSALLSKGYTSQHPDVARNQRDIARAEDTLRRLRAEAPAATQTSASTQTANSKSTVPATTDDPAVAQLKASLEGNRLEIENLIADEKRLKASIAQYENRINQTPVREQQQGSVTRKSCGCNMPTCRRKSRNPNWQPIWRNNKADSNSGSSTQPAFRLFLPVRNGSR